MEVLGRGGNDGAAVRARRRRPTTRTCRRDPADEASLAEIVAARRAHGLCAFVYANSALECGCGHLVVRSSLLPLMAG